MAHKITNRLTYSNFHNWWTNVVKGGVFYGSIEEEIIEKFPNRNYLRQFNNIKK